MFCFRFFFNDTQTKLNERFSPERAKLPFDYVDYRFGENQSFFGASSKIRRNGFLTYLEPGTPFFEGIHQLFRGKPPENKRVFIVWKKSGRKTKMKLT